MIACEVSEKLVELGGEGKMQAKIHRARIKLKWFDAQAPGRIKRFIYGEQQPLPEEVDHIRAVHAKHCLERIDANRQENERLFEQVADFIGRAQQTDPEFYRPHIEALCRQLDKLRNMGIEDGGLARDSGEETRRT